MSTLLLVIFRLGPAKKYTISVIDQYIFKSIGLWQIKLGKNLTSSSRICLIPNKVYIYILYTHSVLLGLTKCKKCLLFYLIIFLELK